MCQKQHVDLSEAVWELLSLLYMVVFKLFLAFNPHQGYYEKVYVIHSLLYDTIYTGEEKKMQPHLKPC